jgi:hypothetical protein
MVQIMDFGSANIFSSMSNLVINSSNKNLSKINPIIDQITLSNE